MTYCANVESNYSVLCCIEFESKELLDNWQATLILCDFLVMKKINIFIVWVKQISLNKNLERSC